MRSPTVQCMGTPADISQPQQRSAAWYVAVIAGGILVALVVVVVAWWVFASSNEVDTACERFNAERVKQMKPEIDCPD